MSSEVSVEAPLILLHPDDNIASLTRGIRAGDPLRIDGREYRAAGNFGLGHKIAVLAVAPGEKIIKWGAPIGSATQAIAPGQHVHLHNMKSDYLPTYTLEDGKKYEA